MRREVPWRNVTWDVGCDMTSDYERKRFRRNFLLVAAIFLAVSFLMLGIIYSSGAFDRTAAGCFILIGVAEIAAVSILYVICAKEVRQLRRLLI